MQPSSLFRHMTSSSGMNQKDKEEDLGTLDQQVIILLQSELQNVPTLTCFTSIITPGHHFENDFSDPRSFYHFFQSYYLCYSLLTLANEASNFQFFPAHQKVNSFFPVLSDFLDVIGLILIECLNPFLFFLSLRSSCCFCQLSWKRMLNVTSGRVKNVFIAAR